MYTSNFPVQPYILKSEAERLRSQAKSINLCRDARRRLEWMIHVKASGNVRATCRHFGIAPKIFYFWQKRFKVKGLHGLIEQSRKPKTVRKSNRISEEEVRMICLRKEHLRESAKKLSIRYRKLYPDDRPMSAYQFECVIKKHNLYYNPKKNKRLQWKKKNKGKKLRITDYKPKKKPLKTFEVDTIVLFWGSLKFYLLTAVDRLSRVAFARLYTSHGSCAAADFLKRLVLLVGNTDFACVPDNGSEFLGNFEMAAKELGITLAYARPNTPKDKPQVERFNRTVREEFIEMGNAYLAVDEFNRRLTRWLIDYNFNRPHQSLKYLTPLEWVVKYYPRVLPMYPVHTIR